MSSLKIQMALSHPQLSSANYLEDPLYAVLDIQPSADPLATIRAPLILVLVVDASGTMHNFQLSSEEREYWLGLAISRDEIERGQADQQEAVYWSGQTLAEMQSVVRTPMSLAVEAIKQILTTLQPDDRISVVAFADQVHTVFSDADWKAFPQECLLHLDALRDQRLPADLGTGTYMGEALRVGSEALRAMRQASPHSVSRLIVISDGIVQDHDSTMLAIAAVQEDGFAITTIGVGDEFDEEFLTQVADHSRGEYHYAADMSQIVECLQEEMTTLESTAVTDLYIAVRGLEGAVVQEISLVRPAMSLFDEVDTDEGWLRTRVGDVSEAAPVGILIQIAPPTLPKGPHGIAEAQLTWSDTGPAHTQGVEKATVTVIYAELDQAAPDPVVMDLVERFSVYKLEREAQHAQEAGDLDQAREKLGAATRALRRIGQEELAQEIDQQIAGLGGTGLDPTRVKRIKATTRRLGSLASSQTAPADATSKTL